MYFTNLCLYKTKEIQMLFQSLDPAHNNIMHFPFSFIRMVPHSVRTYKRTWYCSRVELQGVAEESCSPSKQGN